MSLFEKLRLVSLEKLKQTSAGISIGLIIAGGAATTFIYQTLIIPTLQTRIDHLDKDKSAAKEETREIKKEIGKMRERVETLVEEKNKANSALESRNNEIALLEKTQYDKALSQISSQKELYEGEIENLKARLIILENEGKDKSNEANELRKEITKLRISTKNLNFVSITLKGANIDHALFQEPVNFIFSVFETKASFLHVTFKNEVLFSNSVLNKANFDNSLLMGAVFDGSSLKGATFKGTDLSGADLSGAIIDSTTKLPVR